MLDTPREAVFDGITRQAAEAFGAPIAFISLVDRHRVWFKSKLGITPNEAPREHTLCAYALLRPSESLIVPDTRADERFVDNPFVVGEPFARFYAGMPLRSPDGPRAAPGVRRATGQARRARAAGSL